MSEKELVTELGREKEVITQTLSKIAELKIDASRALSSYEEAWFRLLFMRMKIQGQVWCSECGDIVSMKLAPLIAKIDLSNKTHALIYRPCDRCREKKRHFSQLHFYPAVENDDGTFSYGHSLADTANLIQLPSESGYRVSQKAFREKVVHYGSMELRSLKAVAKKFNMPPRIKIDLQNVISRDL